MEHPRAVLPSCRDGIAKYNGAQEDSNMPLRDHFRPPLDNRKRWDALHGQWPAMMVIRLNRYLPPQYAAEPGVHLGSVAEVDVSTYEEDELIAPMGTHDNGNGGVATATWAPPQPTATLATD